MNLERILNAIQNNNRQALLELINTGMSVNTIIPEEGPMLIFAVRHCAIDVIRLLLELKANVDCQDDKYRTPLHWAAMNKQHNIAELLILYHASLNIIDENGLTPVMIARAENDKKMEFMLSNVSANNHHADLLALRDDIRLLTEDEDVVSEALQQLPRYVPIIDERYRENLQVIYRQLLQPDELLDWNSVAKHKKKTAMKEDLLTELPEYLSQLNLKIEDAFFAKINNVINEIIKLQAAMQAKNYNNYPYLSDLLIKAKGFYTKFIQDVCQYKGIKRIELCQGRLRIRGYFGIRYMHTGIGLRFTPHIQHDKTDDKSKLIAGAYRDNKWGTHPVIQLFNTFYKIRPTAPGIEHAVDSLNKVITGHGSAPSELLMLEKGSQIVPVIASKAVEGENFIDLFIKEPGCINHLNSFNYTAHVIMSLLTCPSDAKPDNFIAVVGRDSGNKINSMQLVGIDNDMAFGEPIYKTTKDNKEAHVLELKSFFFCMDEMNKPVNHAFTQAFIKQPPALLMIKWMKSLLIQERIYLDYKELIKISLEVMSKTSFEKEGSDLNNVFQELQLPLRFFPNTLQKCYERLVVIHKLLSTQPNITHQSLLDAVYPCVGAYYRHTRAVKNTLIDRISFVYSSIAFTFEDLFKNDHDQLNKLQEYKYSYRDIKLNTTESIAKSCIKFFNQLDYKEAGDIHIQGYILERLGTDFNLMDELVIKNCDALNDDRLETLAYRFSKLRSLMLENCQFLQGAGLSALVRYHPDIMLKIDNINNFASTHLIHAFQYCKQVIIVMDGKEYDVKKDGESLINKAYLKNQSNLITALLLSGLFTGKPSQTSPLHLACMQGNIAVAKELLVYGALIEVRDEHRKTPLDHAIDGIKNAKNNMVREGYVKIIKLLIKHGAVLCQEPQYVLKSITLDNLSPQLQDALYKFACCYNLLTEELVPHLINPDNTTLALRVDDNFNLCRFQLNRPLIQAIAKHRSKIEILNITDSQGLNKEILLEIGQMKNLQTVMIDFDQANSSNICSLENIQNANKLYVGKIKFYVGTIRFINKHFTPEDLHRLGSFIRTSSALQVLELCNCHLNQTQISILASYLQENKSLKYVSMNKNPLGDEGVNILLQALINIPTLQYLNLSETGAGQKSAIAVGKLIVTNDQLVELSLFKNPLSNKGIEEIASIIHGAKLEKKNAGKKYNFSSFKIFILNEVGMSDKDAVALARAMMTFNALEKLDVGYNKDIGNAGAEAFIQLAQLNPRVKYLKADGIGADSRIMQQIQQINYRNQQLYQKASLQHNQSKFMRYTTPSYLQPILPPEYSAIQLLKQQIQQLQNNANENVRAIQPQRAAIALSAHGLVNNWHGSDHVNNQLQNKLKAQYKILQDNGYKFSAECKDNCIKIIVVDEPSQKMPQNIIKFWLYVTKLLGTLGEEKCNYNNNELIITHLVPAKFEFIHATLIALNLLNPIVQPGTSKKIPSA